MSVTHAEPRPSDLPGRVRFDVPRREAERIGRRLRDSGIPAVVCVEGQGASIEVPADTAPEAVEAALSA